MQTYIDDSYLDKLGAIKNGEYRDYLGSRVLSLLNMRIANRVADMIDENQTREMLSLPEGRRMAWLQSNISGFDEIVEQELADIVRDIKAVMPS